MPVYYFSSVQRDEEEYIQVIPPSLANQLLTSSDTVSKHET